MRSVRQLPLKVRYAFTTVVAVALFVGLVIAVRSHQSEVTGLPANPTPAQAAAEQRQDRAVVAQQQAPQVVNATATGARAAATAAVDGYLANQVSRGLIVGPVDGAARCLANGATAATAAAFGCRITAGPSNTLLTYPFDVVVDSATHRVTFCQVVTSPDPNVASPPVSARCR